jgi:hypothetical protein
LASENQELKDEKEKIEEANQKSKKKKIKWPKKIKV